MVTLNAKSTVCVCVLPQVGELPWCRRGRWVHGGRRQWANVWSCSDTSGPHTPTSPDWRHTLDTGETARKIKKNTWWNTVLGWGKNTIVSFYLMLTVNRSWSTVGWILSFTFNKLNDSLILVLKRKVQISCFKKYVFVFVLFEVLYMYSGTILGRP